MEIIDLSHRLETGMPVFPGTPSPTFSTPFTVEKDGFKETHLDILTHVGTHIDCPAHMLESDITTDNVPLDRFYGKATVIDCRKLETLEITHEYLQKHEQNIINSDFVLLRTDHSDWWGTDKYFSPFPTLTVEAAQYLVEKGVKGIGLDVISIDAVDAKKYIIHEIILGNKISIIENLTNLKDLPISEFYFSALPLKIKEGDGSPVRAVAIIH